MTNPSRFWDRIAEKYARQPVADEATYQKKLQITRELLRPDMRLLEFGCGTGSTAIALAPHVAHIRAIDFSQRMIDIARDKAAAGGIGNVDFEQATLEALEAADGSFDAVLGHSILHLLKDRPAALRKTHRLLSPGGLFVSSTACIGDFMKWFRYIAPVGRAIGRLPYVEVFTRATLEKELSAAGFEIQQAWQPDRRKALFVVARAA